MVHSLFLEVTVCDYQIILQIFFYFVKANNELQHAGVFHLGVYCLRIILSTCFQTAMDKVAF